MNKVEILYDDRDAVPASIGSIVRNVGFGDIVRRRQRLRQTIEQVVARAGLAMRVIAGDADLQPILDDLALRPANHLVFRIPASLVPCDMGLFEQILRKLPYALEAAVFQMKGSEALTLLRRDEAQTLLEVADAPMRRQMLLALRDRSLDMGRTADFWDLRDVSEFLAFMSGATEARHFNQLSASAGVFRKSSTDKAKMRAEHDFFYAVPPAMKRFLLPTFDFFEDDARAGYAMESMRIPDGALQLIHNSFDTLTIGRLLESFFAFIEARHRQPASRAEVRAAGEREMVTKLDRRLGDFMAMDLGRRVDRLLADGGVEGGLGALHERARAVIVRELDRDTTGYLAVSHGDPCLSNILFNGELGLFRLIDPRGASHMEQALMHPAYDLAKLSHSLLGGYDFVNNGLFECKLGDDLGIGLELDNGGPPAFIGEAFLEGLKTTGLNLRLVRACEMSLFLSMLPLHSDAPRKLPAFCLIARNILKDLEATA